MLSYSNLSSTYKSFTLVTATDYEPQTYNEVVQVTEWFQAINEELTALEANNIWNVVPLPKGRKALGSKWVFKIKRKSDGTYKR